MEKLNFNDTVFFGVGSTHEIENEVKKRRLRKGFIITDNDLISCGVYQKVANILTKAKVPSVMFSDVGSEPTVRDVKNALFELKRSEADFVLAVGGGSVIDTAKAIAVLAKNTKYTDIVSLAGEKSDLNAPLAVFAVPTTAGSGAEASKSFVILDEVQNKPIICTSDLCLPAVTFYNSELLTSMPDIVTLSSGFDALTHAIESLISKKANAFTRALSKEAIKLALENLPKSYDEPEDLEARENMAYASYLSAVAHSNSGLGLCHSIAHAVGGRFNIPHGIILAMTLPAVLKFNMYSQNSEYYKFIAEAFGLSTEGKTKDEICRATIKELEKFRNDFNIPKKLSDYGVKEENLDILALNTFEDACTNSNPRAVTVSEIYLMLKKLL